MSEDIQTEKPKAKPGPKPKAKVQFFENVTKNNCFTEKGRIGPGMKVELTFDQAEKHKALKPCES